MPNYLEYQKSIAAEFRAYEMRVRNLIDNKHWGEEGRYKEIILMNYLKRVLPPNLSVGTGFIRNDDRVTTQIDIIIYDNSLPVLFSEGDFIITTSDNVVGIIEVKSLIKSSDITDIIEKSNKNGHIIVGNTNRRIFNGIFSYNIKNNISSYIENIKRNPDDINFYVDEITLRKEKIRINGKVNHMCFSDKYFIKLWNKNELSVDQSNPKYKVYDLNIQTLEFEEIPTDMVRDRGLDYGLAFSYFLSNLQEFSVNKNGKRILNSAYHKLYYPIPGGKELYGISDIKIL